MKIVFISCVKSKLNHSALATELYISSLFKKNLAYAKLLNPDKIFILSAKYGLVYLDQKLEPYEQTLNSMKIKDVQSWANNVAKQLIGNVDFNNDEAIFLAGEKYRKFISPLFSKSNAPMQGLGFGRQLQWLDRNIDKIIYQSRPDQRTNDVPPPINKHGDSSDTCNWLHSWANTLPVFTFSFNSLDICKNGIYLLFEKGEEAHGYKRIVRVGTHTGQNQLSSRLRQHFINENKDRSIFRKNIGRCLLNKEKDLFLSKWEIDLTTKQAREINGKFIDPSKLKAVEQNVSSYMRENFSFTIIPIETKDDRLRLESRLISTISNCSKCSPSDHWLGLHSPKQKIHDSGLWLVNELNKSPLTPDDINLLQNEMHTKL